MHSTWLLDGRDAPVRKSVGGVDIVQGGDIGDGRIDVRAGAESEDGTENGGAWKKKYIEKVRESVQEERREGDRHKRKIRRREAESHSQREEGTRSMRVSDEKRSEKP